MKRLIAAVVFCIIWAWCYTQHPPTMSAEQRLQQPGLHLGVFRLADDPVVDGDTIRLHGVEASVRVLFINTPEIGTPEGEKAKAYAQVFFAGHTHVRLERDRHNEHRDLYGRHLAYVSVDGQDYGLSVIRAGHSSYVDGFGRSRRFHKTYSK